MKRLAVLVSGNGTILKAIYESKLPIAMVLADRPCPALDFVKNMEPRFSNLREAFAEYLAPRSSGLCFNREVYTKYLMHILKHEKIDIVMMAGFKTILHGEIFNEYGGKILNTHPSLLPSFPGPHAVRDALEYGVKVTGFTLHWATAEVDYGKIIAQVPVDVREGDTEETLHKRIKGAECAFIPKELRRLMKA